MDRTLKVLQLVHNLKREGAQVVVFNLARALDRSRWTPVVCGWHALGPLATPLRDAGLAVLGPGPGAEAPSVLAGVAEVRRALSEHSIDIVHAHMSDAAILAFAASRGLGVPFVVTHHSNRLMPASGPIMGRLRRAMLLAATRSAAINVAVSQAVRDRLGQELGLDEARTACIGNGVEMPEASLVAEALDRRRQRDRNAVRIVMVGRLSEVKRHATLIAAMPLVLAERPMSRACIVGDGPLRNALERLAAEAGVSAAMSFVGSVDDVGQFLAEADLLVAASTYEGLPMAVLEAMSWGLAVVASDVPGHRDVIEDGRSGLLFPIDDHAGLAAAILNVSARPDLCEALGTAARARIGGTYGSRSMAAKYASLYESVMKRPHG